MFPPAPPGYPGGKPAMGFPPKAGESKGYLMLCMFIIVLCILFALLAEEGFFAREIPWACPRASHVPSPALTLLPRWEDESSIRELASRQQEPAEPLRWFATCLEIEDLQELAYQASQRSRTEHARVMLRLNEAMARAMAHPRARETRAGLEMELVQAGISQWETRLRQSRGREITREM